MGSPRVPSSVDNAIFFFINDDYPESSSAKQNLQAIFMCLLQSFVLWICCVLLCLIQKSKKPNPARAVSLLLYVASFFVLWRRVLLCLVQKSNRDQVYVCCKFCLCYEFVLLDPRRKQSEKTKPASNSLEITDREPATTLVVHSSILHYYYEWVCLLGFLIPGFFLMPKRKPWFSGDDQSSPWRQEQGKKQQQRRIARLNAGVVLQKRKANVNFCLSLWNICVVVGVGSTVHIYHHLREKRFEIIPI